MRTHSSYRARKLLWLDIFPSSVLRRHDDCGQWPKWEREREVVEEGIGGGG